MTTQVTAKQMRETLAAKWPGQEHVWGSNLPFWYAQATGTAESDKPTTNDAPNPMFEAFSAWLKAKK